LLSLFLSSQSKFPKLALCTQISLVQSLRQAASLGLEVNSPLQFAVIIPYKNKNGEYEAQFQPMYRGLIELARRSGKIKSIYAEHAYDNDLFDMQRGVGPKIDHKIDIRKPRGAYLGSYSVVFFKDGEVDFEWMPLSEINIIKSRSKSPYGPWSTDEGEMRKKTVIKRLLKRCPITSEMAEAVQVDNETNYITSIPEMLPPPVPSLPPPVPSLPPSRRVEPVEPTEPPKKRSPRRKKLEPLKEEQKETIEDILPEKEMDPQAVRQLFMRARFQAVNCTDEETVQTQLNPVQELIAKNENDYTAEDWQTLFDAIPEDWQ